ncbi:MAG: ABC transporter substrate-binding protein, partial [Pseudomonadota bacterium]
MTKIIKSPLNRRSAIKGAAASAAIVSGLSFTKRARAADTIKIGFVSPKTGPLAPFAESDDFVIGGVAEALKDGLTIDGTTYGVEIIVKDSQSNPNRAADVASDLILSDEVNLMVVSSTPETTN